MAENDNDFMSRLRKQQEERREQAAQPREELKTLKLEPNTMYRFELMRAWGTQNEQYGDQITYFFDKNSPVAKSAKLDGENCFNTKSGVMRTLRQRVLRDVADSDKYPEMESGFADEEPILVKVPKFDGPKKVQFVIVEEAPKKGQANGFRHVFGEVVNEFGNRWESPEKFVERMKSEREEYLKSKRTPDDEGGKIGHKEMDDNKVFHAIITRAYAPKDDPTYMIFRIDTEKSKLWDGYNPEKDGKKNRFHMHGITLKTFVKLLACQAKPDAGMIQVGVDKDKNPEFVQVPLIPPTGVEVRFFRQSRKSGDFTYHECLGERLN